MEHMSGLGPIFDNEGVDHMIGVIICYYMRCVYVSGGTRLRGVGLSWRRIIEGEEKVCNMAEFRFRSWVECMK